MGKFSIFLKQLAPEHVHLLLPNIRCKYKISIAASCHNVLNEMVPREMFVQLYLFVILVIEEWDDFDAPGGLFNFLLLEKTKFPRHDKRPEYFLPCLNWVLLIVDDVDVVVELSR